MAVASHSVGALQQVRERIWRPSCELRPLATITIAVININFAAASPARPPARSLARSVASSGHSAGMTLAGGIDTLARGQNIALDRRELVGLGELNHAV